MEKFPEGLVVAHATCNVYGMIYGGGGVDVSRVPFKDLEKMQGFGSMVP